MRAALRKPFCAFLFLLPCIASANPANVLVGDLTFARPEKWKWAAPADGSAATSRFIVAPDTELKPGTEVRFYITDRKPKSSIAGWKSYFPDPVDREKAQEERTTVRGRKVVWFTIRGRYAFPKTPPRNDYLFVGVMISHGEQYIMVRLSGPESDGGKALPEFKQMVNDAVTNAPEQTPPN